ncbi:hypothetical protein [Gordonia alkanivorans]|uniref:Tape measure protein n=2 Tax=root TaxID=1 RepID=F9VYY6_9ACTN|nr:hypothetical protein [Gordonia alkanivorans]YP_009324410.1 tail length tape measure protein [Gordonia phage GAL1]AKJ72033.1 putative tape measure protein [Gordonia phage GAL1]GAA13825.1 hypothetical protein GOALK_093_00130 [Gordonia alkanivorans NBRC 16433]
MAVYSAGSAKIDISADMSGLANEIRRTLERMQVEYDIDVGADLTRLRTQLRALRDESVDVRVDLSGASPAQIEATARSLRDLAQQMGRIRAIGDVNAVTRATFSSNLSTAELETTARALRDLATAVTRLQAAGDVRTIIDIDVRGIQNIILLQQLLAGLDRRININVNTSGLDRVNGGAQSATRSLTTMQKVKFTALAAGIASLVPALVGVAGAAGGAAAALGAMGAVGIVGGVGIGDAFSALSEQTANAGAAAEDLVDKQSAVADALLSVENAQQGVADAQRSAVDAQRDLNDSYEEASRYLRDMNDELVSAEIAQERAEIALAKARGRRIEVNSDPRSTTVDRAEADVDVRDALQRLREAKSKTADQRADTTRANNAGIGGSDIVQQAKTRSDQANRAVVDAQNQLTQATRQLAEAQRDATSSAAGGVDKFAQAMAKLAPAAQDFVLQMRALGPAWTELRKATQQAMFDGLGDSVTEFANKNMAGFQSGMVQIAGYINTTFKDTLTSLSDVFARLSESGVMQQFITSIGSMMSGLAPMIAGITEGFIQMGAAAGPGMGILFESIGQLVATTGPFLGQLGNILAQSLASIMPTLGEFINAIAVGLGPVLPVLADLISGLGQALLPVLPPLSQLLVTLGQALTPLLAPLGEALAQLGPPLSAIVAAAGDLLLAISPILPVLGQLLAQIITPLASALGAAFQAMQPFVAQWAEQLAPLMQVLGPALAQVGTILSQALVEAVQTLMPHMLNLVNSVVRLMVTLTPLLPQLAEMAVSLLPFLMQSLEILLPPFIVFIDLLNRAAQWALPMMMGALNLLTGAIQGVASVGQWFVDLWSDIWTTVSNTLSGKSDEVIGKFGELVRFVQDLPGRIRNAAAGMWDGIKDSFKGVLNWIISAWNNFSFTIKSPSWMGGKSVSLDTPDLPLLKAAGGAISGPGGPRDDLIPAMLSNGEYVVNAKSVGKYGVGFMDQVNAGRFADGSLVGTYGLTSEAEPFPQWVNDLGGKYAVDPSTYAGHQSDDRAEAGFAPNPQGLNRGIDWGGAVDAMQRFAEYLFSIAPSTPQLEQIIWQNPGTGQTIGWAGRSDESNTGYYADDWSGHQDHVHSRFSGPVGVAPRPNPYEANPLGQQNPDAVPSFNTEDGRSDAPKYAPEPSGTSTTSTTQAETKSYPTSFSGWAELGASSFIGGQTRSLLGVLGINDSPGFLTAGQELLKQQEEARKKQQELQKPQTTTPQTTPQATTPAPQSSTPEYMPAPAAPAAPPAPAVIMDTPEGGIAPGSPGAKETVFAEWGNHPGWQQGEQWLDTLRLINGESSWDESAANPASTAQGLFQFLDTTRAQFGYGPTAKEQAGPGGRYILERYGSPSEAWAFWNAQSPHWYHTGGQVAGAGDVPAWLEGGEYVVNRHAARANMPLLETINARRPMPSVGRRTNKAANGRVVNNNWTVQASPMDAIEAGMREQDRRAAAQMAGF